MNGAPLDLLYARQSIRHFSDVEVPPEIVDQLIDAAARAPSAHNRQPWRFCLLRDPAAKVALADAMGRRLQSDRDRDGDDRARIHADLKRSRDRITRAPLVVLVCLTMESMDQYADPVRCAAEHLVAVQSTAMAGQNLLLAAQAYGLGTCWMCAPLFCPDAVRSVLLLPDHWEPQGLVLLGFPAEAGRNRPRRARDSIVINR